MKKGIKPTNHEIHVIFLDNKKMKFHIFVKCISRFSTSYLEPVKPQEKRLCSTTQRISCTVGHDHSRKSSEMYGFGVILNLNPVEGNFPISSFYVECSIYLRFEFIVEYIGGSILNSVLSFAAVSI